MFVSMLHIRVHAAYSCPSCIFISMLHVHIHVHVACSCLSSCP
jgi:hypothetical protein